MERQFSNNEDIFEACWLFLKEFCDPYLSDVDSTILAMYRASKELQKLRKHREKQDAVASMIHEFENDMNEQAIRSLKKTNTDLLMKIRKITRNIGTGDN